MPPLESGNNAPSNSEQANIAQERAKVCADSRQECLAHQSDMQKAHPESPFGAASPAPKNILPTDAEKLPSTALTTETIGYLTTKCAGDDRLLTSAKVQAQKLLQDDPTILGKEGEAIDDLGQMLLDDCVSEAKIAAKTKERDQVNANIDVLSENLVALKERITGNLTGEDKAGQLANLIQQVKDEPDFPKAEREAALKQLGMIAATLDELTKVEFENDESRAAFNQIISSIDFDLGAATLAETFAPVMEQVEASGAFAEADKKRLRIIVTGSDVQDSLAETVTDENGHTEYRFSEKNKRPIRTGVAGYTEPGGHQIIEAKAGTHIINKDVTGWSGEDIGSLVEIMHYWNATERQGTTGFVESVYKVDFSILGDGGLFDPLTVIKFRQVISHMTGGFAGYDGDIENFDAQQQLIQNQSRLLSETMTTFGWENDEAGTTKVLRRLGMENEDGTPNLEVIKSFGDYTQRNYGVGNPDQLGIVDFLHKMHPDFVEPVSETERQQSALNFDKISDHKS